MEKTNKNLEYPGKLAESQVIPVAVHDPRMPLRVVETGLYEVPVESQIQIPVIFDYTEFDPTYSEENSWWYYNTETNTVHAMIKKTDMDRFLELSKKVEITENEENELTMHRSIVNSLLQVSAEKALQNYAAEIYEAMKNTPQDSEPNKRVYRTKAKADGTDRLPSILAVITNDQYRDGLNLNQTGGAYLQPLVSTNGLSFDGKNLFFKDFPASEATLREINQDKEASIESIDLPLLRMFYSIILTDFETNAKKEGIVNEIVTVYVPDLAKMIGKERNISKNDIKSIIDKTASFQTIYGVLKDPERPNGIGTAMPLLVWMGYQEETNTIRFSSPYMTELIRRIYNVSIRKDKKGIPQISKKGLPLRDASYSYLVKSSIVKERNKKAVEIVIVVVTTIEQAGKHVPHIKARTIIDRVPQLQAAIAKSTSTSNQNLILKRAFTKAWEILETQTKLREKYPTIVLPDPKDPQNIPTMARLDYVFEFPHGCGK